MLPSNQVSFGGHTARLEVRSDFDSFTVPGSAGVNYLRHFLRRQNVRGAVPVSVDRQIVQMFAGRCIIGAEYSIHLDNLDAALYDEAHEQSPGLLIPTSTAA